MKIFQRVVLRCLNGLALLRLVPVSLIGLLPTVDRHGQAEEVCQLPGHLPQSRKFYRGGVPCGWMVP